MTVTLSRRMQAVTNARTKPMPVVAVTGAADGFGPALVDRLAASPQVKRVIAIDDHRGESSSSQVTWRVADIRDPALGGRLTGIDVVIHADIELSPDSDPRQRRAVNVRGTQTVLTAAAASQVGQVMLITSAMVYGARPENPVPLNEQAPLAAALDSSVAGDLLEIEQLARRSRRTNPGLDVSVVRPALLAGGGIDTLLTRHFEAPRLLTVKGCTPCWQFCHVDDLASSLEFAVAGGLSGEFAVGCDDWLEQAQVEEISGLKSIELPAALTFGTAQRLHRIGVTPAPAMDLRYAVYPWVVDCAALREAGWQPGYRNEDVLRELLSRRAGHLAVAGRRLDRKDAALTAAGATVAALGTAAIVRRARRRKK